MSTFEFVFSLNLEWGSDFIPVGKELQSLMDI